MFGEGLNWAGCTIMTLLQQDGKFNIMDFSYHIMRVNMVDMKDEMCKGVVGNVSFTHYEYDVFSFFQYLRKYLTR